MGGKGTDAALMWLAIPCESSNYVACTCIITLMVAAISHVHLLIISN